MTEDISEERFCDEFVGPLLHKLYGKNNVENEKWLADTTCYADYWVDNDFIILAIEVENDAKSIRPGVGQALEYAQNDDRAVPVVITPEGHVEEAQVEELRNVCPIIEIPVVL